MSDFILPLLPPEYEVETKSVLKKCAQANRYLSELKGICGTIPNEAILINTLSIQEAKDSSAIENIISTHDELFKEELFPEYISNASVKEVYSYSVALKKGYEDVRKYGLLTNNIILNIQSELEKNNAGFRKLPGTELKNESTGETVYTPPQHPQDIVNLMSNLEKYINEDEFSAVEPLIKMAIIHYQFESIHPFYDGNGRTGRIINILYLVQVIFMLMSYYMHYLLRVVNNMGKKVKTLPISSVVWVKRVNKYTEKRVCLLIESVGFGSLRCVGSVLIYIFYSFKIAELRVKYRQSRITIVKRWKTE